jgi:hypothetical protein
VGAFPVWRPNLDELDVDSAPASAFLILKSFKIISLQLGCRVPARVLACLLSDGPAATVSTPFFPLFANKSNRTSADHVQNSGTCRILLWLGEAA